MHFVFDISYVARNALSYLKMQTSIFSFNLFLGFWEFIKINVLPIEHLLHDTSLL